MDLEEKIERSGLKAYDIHKMLGKQISVGQASRWIKKVRTIAVRELLWRLCDEKMAQPAKPVKKAKKEAPVVKQVAEKEPEKEWPVAFPVLARSYGEMTVREVGDFWFLEYGGTGWKLPKSRKAEKVQLGKDLVKWSEFKKI